MARDAERMDLSRYHPRFTWEQYLALDVPAGMRYEFDEGRLIVSPSGTTAHSALIAILLEVFGKYEDATDGRHGVALPAHSFFMPPGDRDYQPDVGFIADQRKDRPLPKEIHGAPDIAIEVLSPSTRSYDRGAKADRYFSEGTSEYWLLDPDARTAEFLRRGESGWVAVEAPSGRYATPILPGFTLDLAALWKRLDRKLRVA